MLWVLLIASYVENSKDGSLTRCLQAVDGHAEVLSDTSCMITDTTLQHAHGYSIDLWPQVGRHQPSSPFT